MKELSIFIDESGDFGEYSSLSPYYIVALVLHHQESDIKAQLHQLESALADIGFPHHCIHAGPIIRRENEYAFEDLSTRQGLLKKLMAFIRHIDIEYTTIYIDKKQVRDSVDAAGKLSKQLSRFIRDHYDTFLSFDSIKLYYDNGQVELTRIISSVFNTLLENVTFRRVIPSDYRLFQVADLICTMALTELKLDAHPLSKSEFLFFGDERTLKKNYLKPLAEKKIH